MSSEDQTPGCGCTVVVILVIAGAWWYALNGHIAPLRWAVWPIAIVGGLAVVALAWDILVFVAMAGWLLIRELFGGGGTR